MAIQAKTEQKGKSPYARHAKAPTLYSSEYQNWRQAWKSGRPGEVQMWGDLHSKRFAPSPLATRSPGDRHDDTPVRSDRGNISNLEPVYSSASRKYHGRGTPRSER